MRAAGGTWVQGCRFAILPQVLPNLLCYVLLRFEINIRSASVIGFVGAGGIGEELYKVISFNYYEEISAIVLLIILTVVLRRPAVGTAAPRRDRAAGGGEMSAADDVDTPGARACPRPSARRRRGARCALAGWAVFAAWLVGVAVVVRHHARSACGTGCRASAPSCALMVPPSPGEQWVEILQGLAESVAMAFLGTFMAAHRRRAARLPRRAQRRHRHAAGASRCAACSTASAASTS